MYNALSIIVSQQSPLESNRSVIIYFVNASESITSLDGSPATYAFVMTL